MMKAVGFCEFGGPEVLGLVSLPVGPQRYAAAPPHELHGPCKRIAWVWHGLGLTERTTPRTDAAVRGFQQALGIAVDGIVGPVTWRALVSGMLSG